VVFEICEKVCFFTNKIAILKTVQSLVIAGTCFEKPLQLFDFQRFQSQQKGFLFTNKIAILKTIS